MLLDDVKVELANFVALLWPNSFICHHLADCECWLSVLRLQWAIQVAGGHYVSGVFRYRLHTVDQ